MKLNKEQKELVNKIKAEGYKVRIDEDDETIDLYLEKGDLEVNFLLTNEPNILYFEIYDSEFSVTEKIMTEIVRLSESIAKEKGKIILIPQCEIKSHSRFNVTNFFKKMHYKKMTKAVSDSLNPFCGHGLQKDTYVKEEDLENVKHLTAFGKKFEKVVNELDNKKPLFRVHDCDGLSNEIYYAGFQGSLNLEYRNSEISIVFIEEDTEKENIYKVETPEKIEEVLHMALDKIYAKYKMKSIFNEPKQCLEDLLDDHLDLYDDDLLESIYTALRKHYLPLQIEEIADKHYKDDDFESSELNEEITIFVFGEKVVYLDKEKETTIILDKTEKAIDEIVELRMKKAREEVKESFKDLKII